ncbi:Protein kinase domain-containing protein [Psidium guajava]|nr:Protein kinase domain-containing protein [Psidium guajava]
MHHISLTRTCASCSLRVDTEESALLAALNNASQMLRFSKDSTLKISLEAELSTLVLTNENGHGIVYQNRLASREVVLNMDSPDVVLRASEEFAFRSSQKACARNKQILELAKAFRFLLFY